MLKLDYCFGHWGILVQKQKNWEVPFQEIQDQAQPSGKKE